jgi:hypothetical protein
MVFQGDPHGEKTGDPAGPVILTNIEYWNEGAQFDSIIEWTGDTKFFEFHDIVFLGAVQGAADQMVWLGSTTGAFGMDQIVFEDCIFYNKGVNAESHGNALYFNYGDGDTPVTRGPRVRRCLFWNHLVFVCDDNAVANFDIDVEVDSCVFARASVCSFSSQSGTYGMVGFTVRNCSFLQYWASTTDNVTFPYQYNTLDALHIYNCVAANDENFATATATAIAGGVKVFYTQIVNTDRIPCAIAANAAQDAMVSVSTWDNNRRQWWGYEANWIYEKYFGVRPFLEWEPLSIFGGQSTLHSGGHPTISPATDFYNRPFGVNRSPSRVPAGFYNGDYASAPYNDVIYTYQDPDTVWTSEDNINENIADVTSTLTRGTISTNFLHIEKPWIQLNASQVINAVYARIAMRLEASDVVGNFNFYTLDEAEDLGGFSISSDGDTAVHWRELVEIPAPTGGWTIAHLAGLECRMWKTGSEDTEIFSVAKLMLYIDTDSVDVGAVAASGQKEIETSVTTSGSQSLKITRGGFYQTTIPVIESTAITVTVQARKDSNYAGDEPQIQIFNIPGGTAEVSDTMTVGADEWESLGTGFTPSQDGYATVRLISFCTSEDGLCYFDNLTWEYA